MKKLGIVFGVAFAMLVGLGSGLFAEKEKGEQEKTAKESSQPAVKGIHDFVGKIRIYIGGRVVTVERTKEGTIKVSEEGKDTKIYTADKFTAFVKEYIQPTAFIYVVTGKIVLEVNNGATATLVASTKPGEAAALSVTAVVNLTITDTPATPKDVTVATNTETGKEVESVSVSNPS